MVGDLSGALARGPLRFGSYTVQEWDRVVATGNPTPEETGPQPQPLSRSWASIVNATSSSTPAGTLTSSTAAPKPGLDSSAADGSGPTRPSAASSHPVSPKDQTDTERLAERLKSLQDRGVTSLRAPQLTPRGLLNSGNACFMNVVFQALLACDPFRAVLFALEDIKVPGETCPLLARFVRLAREVRQTPPEANGPAPGQHQDSQDSSPSSQSSNSPASTTPKPHMNGHANTPKSGGKHVVPPRTSTLRQQETHKEGQENASATRLQSSRQMQRPLRPDFMNEAITRRRGNNGIAMSAMFSRGSQEDAQEFLTHILDELHEELLSLQSGDFPRNGHENDDDSEGDEWEEMSRKGKTVVVRPTEFRRSCISAIFGGSLRSELKKPNEKPSVTREPFVCLQLDVEHSVIHGLEDALTKYFEPESLEGYTLESTRETVEVNKRFYLEVLPQVLILHVKRFSYNHENQTSSKVARRIEFHENLVLNPWQMASSTVAATTEQRSYRLTAVVTHLGKELAGGHYTCDVRVGATSEQESDWMFCDDSKLEPLSLAGVLKKQAYLLFYTKVGA